MQSVHPKKDNHRAKALRFNRKTNTYYYNRDFDLIVNVTVQVLVELGIKNHLCGLYFFEKNFFTARLLQ